MPVPTVAPSAVLGGGLVIGLVLGRAWGRRRQPPPVAPELLEQRLRLWELEAEQSSAEVRRFLEAPEFMHELRRPQVFRNSRTKCGTFGQSNRWHKRARRTALRLFEGSA